MEHMMGDDILIKVDNEGNIMGKVYMLQITTISPFFGDGNVTDSSKWNI